MKANFLKNYKRNKNKENHTKHSAYRVYSKNNWE